MQFWGMRYRLACLLFLIIGFTCFNSTLTIGQVTMPIEKTGKDRYLLDFSNAEISVDTLEVDLLERQKDSITVHFKVPNADGSNNKNINGYRILYANGTLFSPYFIHGEVDHKLLAKEGELLKFTNVNDKVLAELHTSSWFKRYGQVPSGGLVVILIVIIARMRKRRAAKKQAQHD